MTDNLTHIVYRLKRRCGTLPKSFLPFIVDGERVGWLHPTLVIELKKHWESVFYFDAQCVMLSSNFATVAQRTEAMGEVTKYLYNEGWFKGWRNELVTVRHGKRPLLSIERGALQRLGITLYSAHLNGIAIAYQKNPEMWLAERSEAKAIDPGCYDTLVGGGLANGLEVMETLIKESWEEAGIGPVVAANAERKSVVRVGRLVDEGWHDEIIYAHDLILPLDFFPKNNDGEVSAFRRFSFDELISLLSDTDKLTVEAGFIVCDYLLRTGYLHNGNGYSELCELIYR